jgi:hypothetical protein
MTSSDHSHFDRLVAKAKTLQSRLLFLPTVAVGGTAVAMYAKHRVSLDVDFVSPLLAERFDDVENALAGMEDFSIARVRRPVLILGALDGDEIGLRQLRRAEPLDAVEVDGLWIPSLAELIRVKAYLLSDRRAVRDFIDVCALVRTAGPAAALAAMESFDALYAGVSTAGPLLAFADAAHDDPVDLEDFDPGGWRALAPAYRDLQVVLDEVRKFAVSAVEADAARRGIADQRPDRA